MKIILIAAMAKNRVIGYRGEMPWGNLTEDITLFYFLTNGHPVIMGRNTWESLPKEARPLKLRHNIVISKELELDDTENVTVARSKPDALAAAKQAAREMDSSETYVIGGEEIYKMFLSLADEIYLTVVEKEFNGDTFFPDIPPGFKLKMRTKSKTSDGGNKYHNRHLARH